MLCTKMKRCVSELGSNSHCTSKQRRASWAGCTATCWALLEMMPVHLLPGQPGDLRRKTDACHFPLLLVIRSAESQFPLKPEFSSGKTEVEECHAMPCHPPAPFLPLWFLILGKFPETAATLILASPVQQKACKCPTNLLSAVCLPGLIQPWGGRSPTSPGDC